MNWRDICLRIGLISTTLVLFGFASDIWTAGEAFREPFSLLLSFLVWLGGLATLILAILRNIPRRVSWLILVSLILVVLGYAYLNGETHTSLTTNHTDNEMIAQFAVEALQNGENPFTLNFTDILRVYRDQGINYTPFLDGAFQHRVTYPALPTLLYTAVDWLGFDLGQGAVRATSLIALIALLILLFLGAPEPLRPIVLLPLFILRDFVFAPLSGVQDVIWSVLLVGMVYAWRRPALRAVLYGLACSFRQQPWFVAPFLLIYMWYHEPGTPRERLRRIGFFVLVSAGAFALINLPFLVWDPGAWLNGALEPSYAPFNYLSRGLGILSEYGIVPFPRELYTVTQVSALAILLVLYWFYAPVLGQAFWIFPGLFFWFYYRGLPSYWAHWIPVLLAAVAGGAARAFSSSLRVPRAAHRPRHAIPVILVAGILLANLGWAATLLAREPLVTVSYIPPIETYHSGLGNRLRVTVHNRSEGVLTPRFAVRPDYGQQTLPWHIISGPEQLRPGQWAEYLIDAKTAPSRGFKIARGAQLAVTDAGGDYSLHALLDIPPQTNYDDPDQIANPDYVYWPQDGPAPLEWALLLPPGNAASLSLQPVEGHTALVLEAAADPTLQALPVVRVQQMVPFPDRFDLWVYPASAATDPATHLYGLEIDDGDHRLWVLFGDSDHEGVLDSENHRYLYQRAPLNTWSKQTIDLRELYEQLGWRQPLQSSRLARGIRYDVPQVRLSLIAGDPSSAPTRWLFGPIEQEVGAKHPDARVDEALDHPDRYYVSIGDKFRSQRNYDLARNAYTKALTYSNVNGEAYFGLGEAYFWLEDYAQARDAFQNALDLMYTNRGAAHKGIGWSEYNLGHYQTARQQFEEAASAFVDRDNPDDALSLADTYNGIGWSWLQTGDCDRATAYFGQALDLAPGLAGAVDGLAKCGVLVP